MPELRFDYTPADWVVFAPLRKLRPQRHSSSSRAAEEPVLCPFCPGQEALTPHVIAQRPTSDPWRIRVVPNKFPALQIEEHPDRISQGPVFQQMGGCGAHEVVIESPEHERRLIHQDQAHVEALLELLHERYIDLLRDRRFQSVIVFKNHGEQAGTSLRHPHWQIIATPVVPQQLRWKQQQAVGYYNRAGESLYAVILREELAAGVRIVASNAEFVALLPYAGHLPFETWILPRREQSNLGALTPAQVGPLAELLQFVLARLYVGLEDPDFNLTIDTAPRGDESDPYFRWHIRILPRLAMVAGFELGSGMSINTVLPEEAAQFLRGGNAGS